MREKKKLVLLLVLVVILVGINLRWRRPAPATPADQSLVQGKETSSIPDPRLRLDLLQKAPRQLSVGRNIFEYRVRAEPVTSAPPPTTSAALPAPPPRPAPLRFYGFAEDGLSGGKRAFVTDGEEIYIVSEGDVIARRYRITRVAAANIEVEDLVSGHRWVIPLEQR